MGGSARSWSTVVPAALVAGGQVMLQLVMTKFGEPSVRIGYSLELSN